MRIMLLGGKGNMGQRYAAILRKLGAEPVICDVGDDPLLHKDVSGVIITTPTPRHRESILEVAPLQVPIICEKPISSLPDTLPLLRDKLTRAGVPSFSMIHQYRHFETGIKGKSFYNYFKHGSDGLVWDCFQVITLATGPIFLAEDSPIWQCEINGTPLDLRQMDFAYVREIAEWLLHINEGKELIVDWDYIFKSHRKVRDFDEICRYSRMEGAKQCECVAL